MFRKIIKIILLGILLSAGIFIAYLSIGTTPALAKICNMLRWEETNHITINLICSTLVFESLEAIGPGSIPIINKSLPFSLNLRRMTPHIIYKWPTDNSKSILINMLNDKDEHVAMGAAYALGEIGGNDIVPILISAIGHPIPMVRHNALNAINHLGKSDMAIKEIINRLNDNKEEIFVLDSAISSIEKVNIKYNKKIAVEALNIFSRTSIHNNCVGQAKRAINVLNK